MALAIDASSPAAAQGATATTTTASFTPPANAAYVAFVAADADSGASDEACTVTDSSGMTWTLARRHNGAPGAVAEVWSAYSASAPGSITVSVTDNKGSVAKRLFVRVYTGADTTVIGASNGTNANSLNYTSTAANSWGWSVGLDNNTSAPVAGSNQTIEDSTTNIGVGDDVWTVKQNATTATPGSTVTMNVTTPGGALHHVAVEILAATAAASIPWRPAQQPQTRDPGEVPWTQRDRRDANTVATSANPLVAPLDSAWQAGARYWHLYGDATDAPARTWQSLQRVYVSDPSLLTPAAAMPAPPPIRTAVVRDLGESWWQQRTGRDPSLLATALLENELLGGAGSPARYAMAATHAPRWWMPRQPARAATTPGLLDTALLENELLGGFDDRRRHASVSAYLDRREVPQQRAYISDPSFYPLVPPTDPLTLAFGAGGSYWLLYNTAALQVDRRLVARERAYVSDPALLTMALLEDVLLGSADDLRRHWLAAFWRPPLPGQQPPRLFAPQQPPADPLLVSGGVSGDQWRRANTAATNAPRLWPAQQAPRWYLPGEPVLIANATSTPTVTAGRSSTPTVAANTTSTSVVGRRTTQTPAISDG